MENQITELKQILTVLGLPETLATPQLLAIFARECGYTETIINDEGVEVPNTATLLSYAKKGVANHIASSIERGLIRKAKADAKEMTASILGR